ncbi:MAG: PilZ domain-containing protein [Bacillaceae bacterium]|nr:PilZ domain-containing protein [Bacillaceae bacterium]
MFYLTLVELIIVLVLLFCLLKYKKEACLHKKNFMFIRTNFEKFKSELNSQKNFQVIVENAECEVRIIDCEDDLFKKLCNKKFRGRIEFLSIKGLTLNSDYNLPIKPNFLLKVYFILGEQEFSIKAKILKKYEHFNQTSLSYDLEFIQLSLKEEKQLVQLLNKIDLERRKGKANDRYYV